MTEYRLRVRFWNPCYLAENTHERHRPTLADEFTDWTTQATCHALGEKIIRDGVWVTKLVMRYVERSTDGVTDVEHWKGGPETFLVQPARIREVSIETREASFTDAESACAKAYGGASTNDTIAPLSMEG